MIAVGSQKKNILFFFKKNSCNNLHKIALVLSIACCSFVSAQNPVNGYAAVIAINDSTLIVNNADESYDTFEDGEKIILMQMQGAEVSDTNNTSGFGNIINIHSAGLYEVCTILNHSEAAGIPDTIRLVSALQNNYTVTDAVQIISFPTLGGGGNFSTTADISCPAFNGSIGGIVAFEVNGNLLLNHSILTDGKGFKGGAKSLTGNNSDCDPSLYAGPYGDDKALKGAGIFKPSASKNSGRAHAANGGGGASIHNGGGAGGGNYTAGGNGGDGWIHCTVVQSNGFGGQTLDNWINAGRIFLGGGGGGGHDNENYGTSGTNGGGIIILKCDTIKSSSTCSAVKISANGLHAASDAQDGKGGGGAGGSIVLDVEHVVSSSNCPLTISANGGNGGNVTISKQHGGGGGGGQGTIMILCGGTAGNVSLETKNGKGGKNMTSFQATYAGDGNGTDNSGVYVGIISDSIPVVYNSFNAIQDSFTMDISWTTTYEKNISSFELQKTYANNPWSVLATMPGHGPGIYTGTTNYSYTDAAPWDEYNTYRLKVRDTNGCYLYSPIWTGYWNRPEYATEVIVYPNPGQEQFAVRSNYKFDENWFGVYDARGRLVSATWTKMTDKFYLVQMQPLASGVYFLRYMTNEKKGVVKVLVQK
jgi:hypothetical protein